MSFAGDLMRFAHELEQNDNAAFDLWTWLPSYKKAEDCLGDYSSEVRPSQYDIMREATHYIAHGCNPNQEQLDNDYQYQCPCNGDCPKQR
jgi:hypothetical protein